MKIKTKKEWQVSRKDAVIDIQKRLNSLKPVESIPAFLRASTFALSYNSLMITYRVLLSQSYKQYLCQERRTLMRDFIALLQLYGEEHG